MLLFFKNLIFTIIIPGTVAVYVPWSMLKNESMEVSSQLFGGLLLFAIGGAIYLWCLWDFAHFGRGTPAPIDPPKKLVVCGLYRYSRNPMYLGVILLIFGWAVSFAAIKILVYALFVFLGFEFWVFVYEEPMLRKRFGDAYEDYCSSVGRWLPKIKL